MAYIGSTPTSQNFIAGTDYFNGTGSQTAFTLTRSVNSVNDIELVINNVIQQPNSYTVSGTTLTISAAPSSGTSNVYVRYLSTNMQSFTVPSNSITRSQLDSNLQAGFQGRNRIINGHMVVDQRNAGSTVAFSGSYVVYLDRWQGRLTSGSGSPTIGQSSAAPVGFTNSLIVTNGTTGTVSAASNNSLFTVIEGYNIADFNWGSANAKTVTLSFWVRSSLTGTFGGSFQNYNNDRSYPFTYTISTANTWEQKSITVTGDTTGTWNTTNSGGIVLWWNLGIGSNFQGTAGSWTAGDKRAPTGDVQLVTNAGATFYITGVQLEEGTTATSFERESYSVTLQKCQRYCYRYCGSGVYESSGINGVAISATRIYATLPFPTQMRATPTISYSGLRIDDWTNGYALTAMGVDSSASNKVVIVYADIGTSSLTTYRYYSIIANNTTSASAILSAEL